MKKGNKQKIQVYKLLKNMNIKQELTPKLNYRILDKDLINLMGEWNANKIQKKIKMIQLKLIFHLTCD